MKVAAAAWLRSGDFLSNIFHSLAWKFLGPQLVLNPQLSIIRSKWQIGSAAVCVCGRAMIIAAKCARPLEASFEFISLLVRQRASLLRGPPKRADQFGAPILAPGDASLVAERPNRSAPLFQ